MKKTVLKGSYGYIEARQKSLLIKAFLCALAAGVVAIIGLLIYKNKLNILMIPAMCLVIPFANYLVSYLAIAKYTRGTKEQYAILKPYEEQGMLISDLAMVNDKGIRMYAEFAVVYKNGIVTYASNKKWKANDMEIHINDVLKRRNVPMRLKVYHDWNEFMERIDGLEIPEDDDAQKRVQMGKEAFLANCL